MNREKDNTRIAAPLTVADLSLADDGDVLISFDDVGIEEPSKVELMLTAFGIQIMYKKTVHVDLIIPLQKLRRHLGEIKGHKRPENTILLAQVNGDGNIQVFDNVPFV